MNREKSNKYQNVSHGCRINLTMENSTNVMKSSMILFAVMIHLHSVVKAFATLVTLKLSPFKTFLFVKSEHV